MDEILDQLDAEMDMWLQDFMSQPIEDMFPSTQSLEEEIEELLSSMPSAEELLKEIEKSFNP